MNSDCEICDVEKQCGYEYKPCDCCNYRKFKPIDAATQKPVAQVYDFSKFKETRELLELAAKAAGFKHTQYTYEKGLIVAIKPGTWGGVEYWNPLTDDGDALRLAVKLKLVIACPGVVRDDDGRIQLVSEETEKDDFAATRLAIVRAAAEIWRAMP